MSTVAILGTALSLPVFYMLGTAIYNVFLHPLRNFPGPIFGRASQLYWIYCNLIGRRHVAAEELHAKYGEVVRVAPDHLLFIGSNAWQDIYMHKQGRPQFQKQRKEKMVLSSSGATNIIIANDTVHARQRKMISHAFSDRALREQEDILQQYVNLLIQNLAQDATNNRPVDIVSFLNYTTFDIIGDLSFAESFHNLESRTAHPWLQVIFKNVRNIALASALTAVPILLKLMILFSKLLASETFDMHEYTRDQVSKRIGKGTSRPDFMSRILPHLREDGTGISRAEINATVEVLIIGGSETTATLLSGAMYLLLKNPGKLEKLKGEVREAFGSVEEINIMTTSHLRYLTAVLEESLRVYPPVSVALPRLTPPGGASICGHFVPEDVFVGVPQRAAYHSPTNFTEPKSFIPERWLPDADEKFKKDRKEVFQPFSLGPRNCVGRNLAYAEMRLILSRMMFEFDFELVNEEQEWTDQKVYILYDKPPLMLRVRKRV